MGSRAWTEAPDRNLHLTRLIIVAGPPCSGKSTFIATLREGRLQAVAKTLEVAHPELWAVAYAKRWTEALAGGPELVMLHYDFLRFWKRRNVGRRVYRNDPALRALVAGSERTSAVTLWTEPAVLTRRLGRRRPFLLRRWLRGEFRQTVQGSRVSRKLRRLYGQHRRLGEHYECWFSFCAAAGIKEHWIGDTTEPVTALHPVSDWPMIRAGGVA
jgi:hypothetical protein